MWHFFTEEEEKSGLRKRLVSESSSVTSEEDIPVAAVTEIALKKVQTCLHDLKMYLLFLLFS